MTMHSFLVGAIFVAMVLAPCAIAMATGVENKEEAQDSSIGSHDIAV
jgi:PBP1b-binding outer membrane lipoprotein LpoB